MNVRFVSISRPGFVCWIAVYPEGNGRTEATSCLRPDELPRQNYDLKGLETSLEEIIEDADTAVDQTFRLQPVAYATAAAAFSILLLTIAKLRWCSNRNAPQPRNGEPDPRDTRRRIIRNPLGKSATRFTKKSIWFTIHLLFTVNVYTAHLLVPFFK